MNETIKDLYARINHSTGLGESPILIDGQARLQLMNLDHNAFCFHNLGYGNEQWLVWRNPKVNHSSGLNELRKEQLLPDKPLIRRNAGPVPECQQCFDEEGSYGCVRPSHEAWQRKIAINKLVQPQLAAECLGPMIPVPEKDKSMFDGLWWSREANQFIEVIGKDCYTIDAEGYRLYKYGFDTTTGFVDGILHYVDERHCSTRTHPAYCVYAWPELKGRFKTVDPGNIEVGKLSMGEQRRLP